MLRFIAKLSILSILLSVSIQGIAQDNEEKEVPDSVKIEFELMPKSFRIGMDMVGLVKTFSKSDYTEFDITSDLSIDRYLINFDYGVLDRTRGGGYIDYSVRGNYFRAGIDVNMLKKDPEGNAFFFGVKYAKAVSDHSLAYTQIDSIFGEYSGDREFNSVNARWFELNSGVKVKLFWEIWLGFTGRLKFGIKHDDSLSIEPYEIPGYGFADRKLNWGFDYFLFYRIPFSKK